MASTNEKLNVETKEGIEALFLYATEGILVVNETGVITRINPSAEKLFGYEKDELLGQRIEALVPKRLAGGHTHHREKYGAQPHPRSMGAGMTLNGLKKNGAEFPVEISLSPYSTDEGKYVIAFIVDITVRKQAEERLKNYSIELERQVKNRTMILEEAVAELERTKLDLHKAIEKEKDLNELKSRFVSMASHEFRTPLTTMLSSLSLVAKYDTEDVKENRQKHIDKIKKSIHDLTDILNDFLSVSKLEEGKLENILEETNLKIFIGEVVAELKPMASTNQKITVNYTGNEVAMVDKKLLRHILFNLVSNAIKFTSPGEGLIDLKVHTSGSSVKILITDNGIGISQEDQKHLFERFFRGRNATNIQGTGLGLNIVARYIELMQGSLNCESEENKGTTFTLIIPQ